MEKGVAAPVRRIDAAAQIIPIADGVNGLIADDLFQDARGSRPVDALQDEKAAVEPGREEVDKIRIHHAEIIAVVHRVDDLLAHAHKCSGSVGRKIEPAEQFLPQRFGREMNLGSGLLGRRRLPGGHRGIETLAVYAVATSQCLEEGDARANGQFVITAEDFSGERNPGGLAAAGQQLFAKLHKAGGAFRGVAAPLTRAVEQRPAPVRYVLQELAEKRRIHHLPETACPMR